VLEDVDLIATERQKSQERPYLFNLLNEMEGLEGDLDILFLLTTNKPEILEPALAGRPGRIDQAIEFPLPDEECRRRLVDLYGRGLNLAPEVVEEAVHRTSGTSPAFIRELLRKSATFAAEREPASDGALTVEAADVEAALREILFAGGELTARLLGGAPQG
jgi:ATP-dependent 26S proteasome regulatory subunit